MTNRTPKLRFLSALLAVAMLMTLLPTAAFADAVAQTGTPVKNLVLKADGTEPDNLNETDFKKTETTSNGKTTVTWTPKEENSGWTWSGDASKMYLGIGSNADLKAGTYYEWDLTAADAPSQLNLYISNYGIIKCADSTEFNLKVYNYGITKADNAKFDDVRTYSGSTFDGGIIKKLEHDSGATLKNAIVYGTQSTFKGGAVEDSIISQPIDGSVKVTASDCTINTYFNNTAYVVGNNVSVEVLAPFNKFNQNKLEGFLVNGVKPEESGINVELDTFSADGAILKFTIPASYLENELKVEVVCSQTPLAFNADGLPVDTAGNRYDGSRKNDGWTYTYTEDTLEDGTPTITNERLRIYPNYGEAVLTGATIPYAVTNWTTLNGGAYTKSVSNVGTVENVTVSGSFLNTTSEYDDGDGNVTVMTGEVISGVFSRTADFGTQTPDITWLNVTNGHVNDIDAFSMAGVVGIQTVTVTADNPDHFDHWDVSGNVNLTALKEKIAKENGADWQHATKLTLELDGSENSTILLTAVTDGYSIESYPIYVFGGEASVNGNAVTAAKASEKVTVTFQAPEDEKRPFLRWDVQPSTLKLNEEATSTTVTFTMVDSPVTLQAQYQDTSDAAHSAGVTDGAAGAVFAVAGVALASWAAYEVGTTVYAKQLMPEGAAMPKTREQLAVLLWQDAGSPLPAGAAEDATDVQKAELWVVETGLMQAQSDGSFAPDQRVTKLTVVRTFKRAHELAPQN